MFLQETKTLTKLIIKKDELKTKTEDEFDILVLVMNYTTSQDDKNILLKDTLVDYTKTLINLTLLTSERKLVEHDTTLELLVT